MCLNQVRTVLTIVLVLASFAAWAKEGKKENDAGQDAGNLSAAYNRFGINLFKEIAKDEFGRNIFISPASSAIALSMVYNGAEGRTKEEMQNALEMQGISIEAINHANLEFQRLLANPDSAVELSIANSLWLTEGFDFRQDFLDQNRKYYNAMISRLDFADPSAPNIINNWVKQHTKDKIGKIVDGLSDDDIMVLINAIYFKGTWKYKFDENRTRDRDFNLLDGRKNKLPMMIQSGEFGYFRTDKYQAVRLPYNGDRISMLIYLPNEDFELRRFLNEVVVENWDAESMRFFLAEGTIVLPRFKLEYEKILNDPLISLGMESAFDFNRANFSGLFKPISETNVFIDEVRQKTFLEISEAGTEAAAATSVRMKKGLIPAGSDIHFSMIVDRPFFVVIRDDVTGLILFMGSITNPGRA